MIIPVGKSSYLECTLGRSVDSAFVITDKEKKASDIYKNILAYRKYFKNHSPIFLLPAKVDLLDVKSQEVVKLPITRKLLLPEERTTFCRRTFYQKSLILSL